MSVRVTTAFIFVIAANTIAIGQDAPVRAGAPGVSHPHLQQTSVPVYPPFAVAARVTGTVLLEAIIDQTGRVTSTTIVKSIPLLDAAAMGVDQDCRCCGVARCNDQEESRCNHQQRERCQNDDPSPSAKNLDQLPQVN